MTKRSKVIKLEAIRYSLNALVEAKAGSKAELARWRWMLSDIDKMLEPYEGVTIYDESVNVGC